MANNPADYLSALADPLQIQHDVIATLETTITGGAPITNGSSVVNVLIEQFSTITGNIVSGINTEFESLYPKRAQTQEELFKHTSEFDTATVMFSTPARTKMQLMFSKAMLEASVRAVYTDMGQNKFNLVIPKDTMFNIGKYMCGIDDDIYMQFDRDIAAAAFYFKGMSANYGTTVLEMRTTTYNGVEFITIDIPVAQFDRKTYYDTVVPPTGFNKVYPFTDRFYKIVASQLVPYMEGNTLMRMWSPVSQTLSDDIYDPAVLTVKVLMDTVTSTVNVSVPYVYINSNKIDSTLKVDIYVTKGNIDLDISSITTDMVNVNFQSDLVTDSVTDASGNNYSVKKSLQILKQINPMILRPMEVKIVGGSNGLSFEEFRSRVINNTFQDGVLVAPREIKAFLQDTGFAVVREEDGLTNRRYCAHKDITYGGVKLSSAFFTTELNTNQLYDINNYIDGAGDEVEDTVVWTEPPYTSFVISPNALYKYDSTNNKCAIVSAAERYRLSLLSRKDRVEEFNSNIYTISPFHTRLDTSYRYPLAYTYDLLHPKINRIAFVKENAKTADQISIYQADVVHNNAGTGGYTLVLLVKVSDSLRGTGEDDNLITQALTEIEDSFVEGEGYDSAIMSDYLRVKLQMTSASNVPIIAEAGYSHEASKLDLNGNLVFMVDINTTYLMTADHKLNVTSFLTADSLPNEYIALDPTVHIVFAYREDVYPVGSGNNVSDGGNVVYDGGFSLLRTTGFAAISRQSVDVVLGTQVPEIYNPVSYSYTAPEYRRRYTTKFITYPADQYQLDGSGIPVLTDGEQLKNDNGDVVLVDGEPVVIGQSVIKTFSAGDVVCTPQFYINDHATPGYNQIYTLENSGDHLRTALSDPTNVWKWESGADYAQLSVQGCVSYLATLFANDTDVYWADKVATIADLVTVAPAVRYAWVANVGGDVSPAEFQMVERVLNDTVGAIYRRTSATSNWIKYVEHTDLESILTYLVTAPHDATTYGFLYLFEGSISSTALPKYVRIMSPTAIDWGTLDTNLNQITGWPWDNPVTGGTWFKIASTAPSSSVYTMTLKSTPMTLAETGFIDVYRDDLTPTLLLTAAQQLEGVVYADGVTKVRVTADIGRPVYSNDVNHTLLITAADVAAGLVDVNGAPINPHTPVDTEYTTGDVWLDGMGEPTTIAPRELLYEYGTIHVDAKLSRRDPTSDETNSAVVYTKYLTSVSDMVGGYLTAISTTKGRLLENTDLVFKPFRSLGLSSYTVNSANLVDTIDLECRVGFRLMVPKHVVESTQLKATITAEITNIVDAHFGKLVVSATAIAEEIRATLPEYIQYVDVFGFNSDATGSAKIQTLINTDPSIRPVLKTILRVDDYNRVIVDRGLELEWLSVG